MDHGRWIIFRYILVPLMVFGACGALVVATSKAYPAYVAIAAGIFVVVMLLLALRRNRRELQSGWRFRRVGRDQFRYEEFRDGKWQSIMIGGEMLMGKPRHVIYMPTDEEWGLFPDWARDRRGEIIARIKTVYPEPKYAYTNV